MLRNVGREMLAGVRDLVVDLTRALLSLTFRFALEILFFAILMRLLH